MPKEMPVNENCNKCGEPIKPTESWGRDRAKFRVHFPRCMPSNPSPEVLDGVWKSLVEEGNDMAVSTEARLQSLAAQYEETLGELRDMARMKLSERPSNG